MALLGRATGATNEGGKAATGRRRSGVALIAVGIAVALVSALADVLFGDATEGGFGWKQVTGVVVGVAAVILGAVVTARDRRAKF